MPAEISTPSFSPLATNHLQALLDKWRANPDLAPEQSKLDSAIYSVSRPTSAYKPDSAAIRPLQEFVFEHKDQNHTLVPTDFLALAQLRLDTGDLPGALELLNRLALQHPSNHSQNGPISFPGQNSLYERDEPPVEVTYHWQDVPSPFVNTDYAASLLEKDHHPAEAIPFLQALVKSVPWDASYRFRLAQAQLASNARDLARTNFTAVARDTSAPYDLRVQAARALDTADISDHRTRQPGAILHRSSVHRCGRPPTLLCRSPHRRRGHRFNIPLRP
jgi:predicted Zn-dependent protease